MKLKFEKMHKRQPIGFAEKILSGLYIKAKTHKEKENIKFWHNQMAKAKAIVPFINSISDRFQRFPPKYHSFRSLKSPIDVGDEIEFLLVKSKSTYIEFAPKANVIAIQYAHFIRPVAKDGPCTLSLSDDKKNWTPIEGDLLEEITQNDGFDSVEAMFEYFLPKKEGAMELKQKLVHWTTLKYPIECKEQEVPEETNSK